ncbi:MAG: hypothetical protein LBP64_09040 [Tannerella sp.]|jgi:hypothetical protein|nr:hypothetical protein [Tannerella sp.]
MKLMYVIFAGLCLWCTTVTTAGTTDGDVRKLIGRWAVTVPDAPYGYQDYTIDIKEKDKEYLIDVKGEEVDVKDKKLTKKDGKLSIELYVGEYVTVTVWEEDGTVKGTADTTQGKLACNFKKAIPEKKQ